MPKRKTDLERNRKNKFLVEMQENRLSQHQFIPMECQEFVYRGQSSFILHAIILVREKNGLINAEIIYGHH